MYKSSFYCLLWILFFALNSFAQDLSGNWTGLFRSNGPSGQFEMNFSPANEIWQGDVAISFEDKALKNQTNDIRLSGDSVEFSAELDGSQVKFSGMLKSVKMLGTFEVFEKGQRALAGVFCVSKDKRMPCSAEDLPAMPTVQTNSQRADTDYDTRIANPAYTKTHPKVLFDEAHRNLHKTTGLYKPLADLLTNDGYSVTPNSAKFSAAALKNYDILIIANAQGKENESAFTDEECDAVAVWVKRGGSLLLIADHAPMGGWAEKLSNRFGVNMSKGYTDDPANRDKDLKDLLFSRENKLLGVHAITNGSNANEKINRIVSFTGQSLSIPKGGVALLKLADTAYDEFPNSDKKVSAANRAQMVAMKFGKGKVIVSGEAAMLTAQIAPNGEKFGLNAKGIDNRRFALNLMHWLSGLLK